MELNPTPLGEFYIEPFVGWKIFRLQYPYPKTDRRTSRIISVNRATFAWSRVGHDVGYTKHDDDEATCDPSVSHTWKLNDDGLWYNHFRKKVPHKSPDLGCMCGWHCYNTLDDCWDDGEEKSGPAAVTKYRDAAFGIKNEDSSYAPYRNSVLALVWAWGDPVWVWDNTTRSTHMKIAALCTDSLPNVANIQQHAENLDVPALSLPDMVELYNEIGIPLGKVS